MSHPIHIWVFLEFLLLAAWADALSSCGSTTGRLQVTQDCILRPSIADANSTHIVVSGSLGNQGFPAIYAEQAAAAAAVGAKPTGGAHVELQQLLLVNFTLAGPGGVAQGNTPTPPAAATAAGGGSAAAAAAAAQQGPPQLPGAAAAAPPTACGAPLLWPLELFPLPGCSSNPGTSSSSSSGWRLSMKDVRILVPPQQLAALLPAFQGLPGVYMDNTTFLHIISYDSPTTHLASVTLLTPDTLAPGSLAALDPLSPGVPSDNNSSSRSSSTATSSAASVHLSVDNATLVLLLVAEGGTPTPAPLLLFLTANVTLGAPPPALAATGGFHVARPVYLVGLASTPTSLDFHQAVNQVNMTGQSIEQVNATGLTNNWARLHLFQLELENLGYGDVTSARTAAAFSTLVVGNLWALVFNRTGPLRVVQHNVTMLVPPVELDYLTWSTTLYSNPLPYSRQQTYYLHNQLSVQYKVVPGPTPASLIMIQANTGARAVLNTTVTITPVVAPVLPRPAPVAGILSPDLPAPIEGVADSSAAVEARLLKQNSTSIRQDIFLVTQPLQLLQREAELPNAANKNTHNTTTNSPSSLAAAAASSSSPASNSPATAATHQLFFEVQQPTMFAGVAPGAGLSWGYAPGVFLLPPGSQNEGYLALQRLRLTQLPQGPPPGQKGLGREGGERGSEQQEVSGGVAAGRQLASSAGRASGRKLLLDHSGRQLQGQGTAVRDLDLDLSPETFLAGGRSVAANQQQQVGATSPVHPPHTNWCQHHRWLQADEAEGGYHPHGRQLQQGVEASPPEAWTLLLWGVGRPVDTHTPLLTLSSVELLLPQEEYAYLQAAAAAAPAFLVPLQGLSQGLSLQGVTASPSGALQVAAFRGPGVVGTNLTLLPDTTPPPPGAHPWPFPTLPPAAAPAPAVGQRGLQGVPAMVVKAVVPVSVVLVAAAGVAACVYARRKRRQHSCSPHNQHQQQQKGGVQKGLSCWHMRAACGTVDSNGSNGSSSGGNACTHATASPPVAAAAAAAGSGIFVSDTRTWDQDSTAASLGMVHVVPVAGLGRRPDAVLPRLRSARDRSEFGLPKGSPAAGSGASQVSLVFGKWQAALAAATGQILGRRQGRSWGDPGQILGAGAGTAFPGTSHPSGGAQCNPAAAGSSSKAGQRVSGADASPAGAAPCLGNPPPAAPGVVAPMAAAGGLAAQQQHQPAAVGQAGGGSGSSKASAAGGVPGLLLERQLGEGSFGTVFAGTWRGKQVAVKVVQYRPAALQQLGNTLPPFKHPGGNSTTTSSSSSSGGDSSGGGRGRDGVRVGGGGAAGARRHEAVVEAAVAAHVCHPNIVQVYTYSLTPVLTIPFAHHGSTSSSTQGSQGGDGAASSSQPPSAAAAAAFHGRQGQQQQQLAASGVGGGTITSWELHLVMEYCDQGSLREALDRRLLCRPTDTTTAGAGAAGGVAAAAPGGSSRTSSHTTAPHLPLVLHLAHDTAAALVHLHAEGIAHGDIKAANVLLTSGGVVGEARRADWAVAAAAAAGGGGGAVERKAWSSAAAGRGGAAAGGANSRGMTHTAGGGSVRGGSSSRRRVGMALTAKLTDFGLAVLNLEGTNHITYGMRGTPAYMSPELLLRGRVSKASDVYALGVLLWECVTGGVALRGVPLALLPHQVAQEGLRPTWPAHLAADPQVGPLRQLVEACWAGKPRDRPTAEQVMHQLEHIQAALHQQQQQEHHHHQQEHHQQQQQPRVEMLCGANRGAGDCPSASTAALSGGVQKFGVLQVTGAGQGASECAPQGVLGPVTASWTMDRIG